MPRRHAMRSCRLMCIAACLAVLAAHAVAAYGITRAAELSFRTQEIASDLTIGYATTLLDMNGDRRTDIVVVDANRVVWYENPGWQVHTIIEERTKRDNVCIAAHDIDGDGRIDFALGADWKPFNTASGGTIQWLRQGASPDAWEVFPIAEEPTTHRMRWIDTGGDGRPELVVVPLMGRGTTKPEWAERGVRVLSFTVPADPARDRWPAEVLDDGMHVTHNFCPTDFDGDGRAEILCTSFEGVNLLVRPAAAGRWIRSLIGSGNQKTAPNRGASEIKHGLLGGGTDYIATVEPWHGEQVVAYSRPGAGETLWQRQVIDEDLKWGHAVWCANLDADADEELIIGIRDHKDDTWRSGVRIYDPQPAADAGAVSWQRTLLDPAGVAVEDLAAADLDADGRIDIVAVGRATKNVRIYWNETGK